MKENGEMKVYLGIDHGYGYMKTPNHIYRNGVEQVWSKPAFLEHTVIYNGNYYIVGETTKAYSVDKTKNLDYYILTLAAIAKELKTRNYSNKSEVILGVGLPIDYWQSQKNSFRDYLMQNGIAHFNYGDEQYDITIRDVKVYPQGYAAIIKQLQDSIGTQYVIDGGSGTLIRLKIANKVPVMTQCESIEGIGLNSCLANIKHELRKAYSKSFDDEILLQIMRKGDKLLPEECQLLVEKVIKSYINKIRDTILQAYPDIDYVGATWCGGLAQVIYQHGTYNNKDNFILDLCANAKGYEYLIEQMGRNKI